MEFQTLLESRRSVRAFDGSKSVTEDQIRQLVDTGIQAPSWKNAQTARYYCVLDEAKRADFLKNCLPEFNAKSANGAALVVTTFIANRSGFDRSGTPDNECGNGWGFYDLGLHNENFLLKAKELGLDTLVMGIRDAGKIREMLSIPEAETIVAVIAVGYGTESPVRPKRKQPDDILKFF